MVSFKTKNPWLNFFKEKMLVEKFIVQLSAPHNWINLSIKEELYSFDTWPHKTQPMSYIMLCSKEQVDGPNLEVESR